MEWSEIGSIELDESIYGKAKIYLKDKEGYYLKILYPKWNARWLVLNKLNERWLNYLKGAKNVRIHK